MRKILLSVIALLCAATAAFAQPGRTREPVVIDYHEQKTYVIAGLQVKGDPSVDPRVILPISGLTVGQRVTIPGDEVTRAINNLWKKEIFSSVRIDLDSAFVEGTDLIAYLSIHLQTRPKLSRYSFPGMRPSKSKKIKEEINIHSNDVVTEQFLANIRSRIDKMYTGKGYPNSKVEFEQIPDSGRGGANYVELRIKVDPGKRIKIDNITFSGNTAFKDKRLKRMMKETKEKQTLNVFRRSKLKPDEYENDKNTLIAFYKASGYKDARLVSDSIVNIGEDLVNIGIRIDEGHKYYFRSVTWSGNTKYSTVDLQRILGLKKGDVYNPELLERNLFSNQGGLDVTSLYMDDGYLFFSANPVETRVEGDSVDLEIRIFEGPQAIINKVSVTGNTRTHDHVILREIRTKPGQKFSRSDIIRSQRELAALGYFDMEKMNVVPKPNPKDGTVDLEYTVVEKPSDRIELSGGYGAGRLVGVLGLTLNNFSMRNLFNGGWQGYPSGDGQQLSIRAQSNGLQFQSYNLSFTEPWFGGKKPNSLTVSAFYSIQRYGQIEDPTLRQELRTPGGSIGLGKRLQWPDNFFTLHHSLTYQYYTFSNFQALIPNFHTGYSNNLNVRHILQRNSANDNIFPTYGSQMILSLQWSPPYSIFRKLTVEDLEDPQERFKYLEFYKWKIDLYNYLPITSPDKGRRQLVLFTGANFGLLGAYNPRIGVTPFERFYVGGDGLSGFNIDGRELIRLRGYASFSDVTPEPRDLQGNVIENGGTIYSKYSFELRYPITLNPSATVWTLAYLEAGNAWQHFSDFNPFILKRAAGVGVRFFLPMFGLLGFDWAYGFDPSNRAPGVPSGSQFHFYIGQPLY